jgi:hypothetical protein
MSSFAEPVEKARVPSIMLSRGASITLTALKAMGLPGMTTRRFMVGVAILAICLAFVRYYFFYVDPFNGFGTIYSQQYSEDKFNSLRAGMTTKQLEAIMGPPLEKIPLNDGTMEHWLYSVPPHYEANYWRRWVLVAKGRVIGVVKDFWVD